MPDNRSRADRIDFDTFEISAALPEMLRWLADPDVSTWYDEGELTAENITRRFAPIPGRRRHTIVIDDTPAGYLQLYALASEPDYQRQVDVDPAAVAIDLFIGEPDYRNRGWGWISCVPVSPVSSSARWPPHSP